VLTFLAGVLVVGLVLAVVDREIGFRRVLETLQRADPTAIVLVLGLGLIWVGVWGYTFHLVLGILGDRRRYRESLLLYSTLLLWNIIAPFSFGGGEPIAAYVIARATGQEYEPTLLAVIATDGLNYSPAPVLAVVGLLLAASMTAVGSTLRSVAVTTAGIVVAVVTIGVLGWRRRAQISGVFGRGARVLREDPRWPPHRALEPVAAAVERRVSLATVTLSRLTADPHVLRLGFATATLGWVLQSAMLWLSLTAVGAHVPVWAPVVVVTVVAVTDVFPVPGGIGAVDAALVLVLVTLTSVQPVLAVSGTLVFRIATFGFPILLGLVGLGLQSVYPLQHD